MKRGQVKRINVVTMGCSKNLVDSERVLGMMERAGIEAVHNADNFSGDAVVINTCGFIGDAKRESIDMILSAAQAKAAGEVGAVYVMGCLAERYRKELPAEIPEVDGWYGKFDWQSIVDDLTGSNAFSCGNDRVLTTPPHHAYLKIAEGCNRFCAFCAIPLITGRFRSRTIDDIVDEARRLIARGVKEFNVIAQDLSSYGVDIYGEPRLAQLVEALAQLPGMGWIRLHYAYPAQFPYDVLPVMARYPQVCRYLDIALQHVNDRVLGNMRRHITGAETRELLARIRSEVPGIHLRTTLMVGFPGEDEEAFGELVDFVREQRFERMGAFAYCEEEGTYGAEHFDDSIPEDVKQERLDRLMEVQEAISEELNAAKVGSRTTVIIDGENDDAYVGRTQYDSPEVDQEVLIEKTVELHPGDMVEVEITDALPFDLMARVAEWQPEREML